ncbi:MAG TPA: S8 family serine peptidase [Phycisphaerales bacterium]|nr:S8 family serine peptidase [Phycisphaerales bacterium]HMP37284.1 S8 family serine peptidase [Phycisphaerales bacterium]
MALAAALALPAVAAGDDAQQVQRPDLPQAPAPPLFVEIPGEREFSGFLIARPLQPDDAEARQIEEPRRQALVLRAILELHALGVEREFPEVEEYVVRVPAGSNENDEAQRLMATGGFSYVEPDWTLYPLYTCPNDPQLSQQWHHNANRLNSCTAWSIETGSTSVTVAICDTGIRATHQDLWQHRLEGYHVPTQKWESQGGPINDIHGHGTLCTGAAAAKGNNGIGVAGMGWSLSHRMMRVTDSSNGSASLSNLTLAARRAAEFGDKVSSVSYSGVNSSSVFTAGTYIRSLGGMLVWAAGNDNVNLNGNREDNVIVVGATDQNDAKASFSNYGPLVDLVAPGVSIRTTAYNSDSAYANVSGTSFATPIVAGLCALIWSRNPDLTPAQVEAIIRSTSKDLGAAGVDNIFGYGRVEAGAALAATPGSGPDVTPPAAPTGLAATAGNGSVSLSWNASPEPDLAGYRVFRSTNGGGFSQITGSLLGSPSFTNTGLVNGWTYAYYVVAEDTSGNVSSPSATASAVPSATVTLFSDGFESGNLTAGGWVIQNTNAFASTASAFAGSWGARLRNSTWIEKSISTVGRTSVTVSYARRTAGLQSGQWLYAEWWNGSSWTLIEQTNATSWQSVSFTLPAGAANNPNFKLRFRTNANNPNRRGDVDVVVVTGS